MAANTSLPEPTRHLVERLVGQPLGDETLWLAAVTHGSFAPLGGVADYQRLEFLGDRVLGLTIATWLYEIGSQSEGQLSQRLNVLVSRQMCASVARKVGLGPHIRLGKQARDDGGADSDNILGDVVEALIGACYVQLGFEATKAMVRGLWHDAVQGAAGQAKHPKSALQEWAAGNRRKTPEYSLVERSGPDHAARFTVEVAVKGVGTAQASANSKQEAETQAAAQFLRQFA